MRSDKTIIHYQCLTAEPVQLQEMIYSTEFSKDDIYQIIVNLRRSYKFEQNYHKEIYEGQAPKDEQKKEIAELKTQIRRLKENLSKYQQLLQAGEILQKSLQQKISDLKFFHILVELNESNFKKEKQFLEDHIKQLKEDQTFQEEFIQFLKTEVMKEAKQLDNQNNTRRNHNIQEDMMQKINDKKKSYLSKKVEICAGKLASMEFSENIRDQIYDQKFQEIQMQLKEIETQCQQVLLNMTKINENLSNSSQYLEDKLNKFNQLKSLTLSILNALDKFICLQVQSLQLKKNQIDRQSTQKILALSQYLKSHIQNLSYIIADLVKHVENILRLENENSILHQQNRISCERIIQNASPFKDSPKQKDALPPIANRRKSLHEETRKAFFTTYTSFLQHIETKNNEFIYSLLGSIYKIFYFHYSHQIKYSAIKTSMPENLVNKTNNLSIQNEEKLFLICQELINKFTKLVNDETEKGVSKYMCEENQRLLNSVKLHIRSTKQEYEE